MKKTIISVIALTISVAGAAQHNAGNIGKILMVASNPAVSKQRGWAIGAIIRRSWVGPLIYGTSIFASFVHPYFAWILFLAVPIYFFWPKRIVHETNVK